MIPLASAIGIGALILALVLYMGVKTLRRTRPRGLPAPDRAAVRDCFNPSRSDRPR